jgi:hypothetical protein
MFNLDHAISRWRQEMAAGGITKSEILDELESHLREDVEQQVRSGVNLAQAFQTAIQRMGEAAKLRPEFAIAARARRGLLRKRWLCFLGVAMGFLGASASLCYLAILPPASRVHGLYALWTGISSPPANLSFVCRFALGMSLGLAMPIVLLGLVRKGIVDHQKLVRLRPYMIVVNLILGAVLTTPEVVTQVMMFVPLQLLCEATIWVTRILETRAKKYA